MTGAPGGPRGNGGSPRVLHVIPTGERRGAEMFAFDLIRALNGSSTSHRVAVLRGSDPLPLAYEAPTALLPSSGRTLPLVRMDARTLRALRHLVDEERPRVVHAHGGESLKYAILATRGRGVRVLYRRIGLAERRITRGLRRVAHANLMRRSDRVVAVAEVVRRETLEVFGVPPERVVTIPRGIDPRRLRPSRAAGETRAALGVPEGWKLLLSLGALHPQKDPVSHVEVGARVLRALPEAVYLIAGDGPLRGDVEAAIGKQGLEGRLRLLGNRSDVGDLLAAADVLVLASRSEGMPGCLIEAGMCGVPAAAYAVGGSPEVVVDGVTGFLVPPGEPDRLATRVVELLSDEPLRRGMGASARTRCRSFDIRAIAPRYAAIYEELGA